MPSHRFYNATDRLVNAFVMNKIRHGQACSCAVGNLMYNTDTWMEYLEWEDGEKSKELLEMNFLDFTGYTPIEIFEVERSFEKRYKSFLQRKDEDINPTGLNSNNDCDGFKGLCNVFDYLVSIEDWKEEERGLNIFELLSELETQHQN